MNTIRYVAFLRGVNVGGNTLVKMKDLKNVFMALGFTNIKTVLASGNVIFSVPGTDLKSSAQKLEEKLESTFGFRITVVARTGGEINSLIKADPFKSTQVTSNTRFHVTFITDPAARKNKLPIPYESADKKYRILDNLSGAVCSVIELTPGQGSPELMKLLENEFGPKITTRTWQTVTKIAAVLGSEK